MAEIIAIANQKGGIGKSTTTINLADALTHLGKKVLVLDLDPQVNTTTTYGAVYEDEYTIVDVLKKDCSAREAVQHTVMGDIIPGDKILSGEKIYFNSQKARETLLKRALKDIEGDYEYIVIDTPPDLDIYMLSTLTTANGCIIPIFANNYAIKGLAALLDTINEIREILNSDLQIYGLLLGRYDARNSLDRDVLQTLPAISEQTGIPVFKSVIRIDQNVQNVQAKSIPNRIDKDGVINRSLFDNYPCSNASIDYVNFTKELLDIIEKNK